MIRVESCCCGCSLRAGSLIILWLNVVIPEVFIFFSIIFMVSYEINVFFIIFASVVMASLLAITSFGLRGIYKNKPSYLRPFIGLSFFVVGASIMRSFSAMLSSRANYEYYPPDPQLENESNASPLGSILGMLIATALQAYFTVVVHSYYKQMVDENKGIGNTGEVMSPPCYPVGTVGDGRGLYPQPQPVYHPFHGQQFGGVYPSKPLLQV